MARVAGIQFENDSKGNHRYVRIDLRKHAEVIPFLEKIGAIEEEDEFEKEWKEGISGKELKKRVKAHINTLPWNKK
jgi:hypothetical protein